MKTFSFKTMAIFLLINSTAYSQSDSVRVTGNRYPMSMLTTEPGIGINLMINSDLVVSNLLQWNLKKRLSLTAYTAYVHNNIILRDFNFIKTDYNYTLSQKAGVGTSFYGKHFSHTFSFMAGIRFDAYKETLYNPAFEVVSVKETLVTPDFGILYAIKVGKKKYFFSYRMYLPLYPYPFETVDVKAVDGNFASLSLEFGVGIRLK